MYIFSNYWGREKNQRLTSIIQSKSNLKMLLLFTSSAIFTFFFFFFLIFFLFFQIASFLIKQAPIYGLQNVWYLLNGWAPFNFEMDLS